MTEIKLTKRYPQSRTEDIIDAYMRGWNDALDAVQNGKFIISDDRKTEPQTELVNDSPILAKDLVDDEFNPYDEECMRCKHLKLRCEFVPSYCKYESKDEPQTERLCNKCKYYGGGEVCDHPSIGEVEMGGKGDTFPWIKETPKWCPLTDEPQTERSE